jgi:hypothetical protein
MNDISSSVCVRVNGINLMCKIRCDGWRMLMFSRKAR